MAFSRIGSSSSIMWYVFVSTEFLKNGFVSKWNSSLKPLGSLILYHLMSLRYLRASSSLSWICKWKDKNYFKQENGLCMKSQQVGTEYWQFSEENYCTKMQDSTSSARISWFFIALSQKAGTPFSSAAKHCDFSHNKKQEGMFIISIGFHYLYSPFCSEGVSPPLFCSAGVSSALSASTSITPLTIS